MASHFDTIGMGDLTRDEMVALFQKRFANSETYEDGDNFYARISMGDGLAYWLCLRGGKHQPELVCDDFHLHSANRAEVIFHSWRDADPLRMNGMAETELVSPGLGLEVPLNLSLPVLAPCRGLKAGTHCLAQIAAYAEEAEICPEEEADTYFSDTLIPCGTFSVNNDPDFVPEPRAILGGRVLSARLQENTLTGGTYWHMEADCLGTVYDVLAEAVPDSPAPKPGDVIEGVFWLTAMLYPMGPEEEVSYEQGRLPVLSRFDGPFRPSGGRRREHGKRRGQRERAPGEE